MSEAGIIVVNSDYRLLVSCLGNVNYAKATFTASSLCIICFRLYVPELIRQLHAIKTERHENRGRTTQQNKVSIILLGYFEDATASD